MVFARREPRSQSTGMRLIWAINSVFMTLLITNSNTILEVRHGFCHFVLVWLLVFSSPPGIHSLHCYLPLLIVNSTPTISTTHARGKPKHSLTYYSCVARQRRTCPSSVSITPPLFNPSLVGLSLENLHHTDQNWMEEDRATIFVEEDFPLVPPQAPPYSHIFSASELQAPPHNSSRQNHDFIPTSTMENFPVEKEIPPTLHDDNIQEEIQLDIEPQPVADSVPEVPSLFRFSEEHLQLIFDMRRDIAEQLHCQTILC
jgi:hypothetical protein